MTAYRSSEKHPIINCFTIGFRERDGIPSNLCRYIPSKFPPDDAKKRGDVAQKSSRGKYILVGMSFVGYAKQS